jgi:hypothetical protein
MFTPSKVIITSVYILLRASISFVAMVIRIALLKNCVDTLFYQHSSLTEPSISTIEDFFIMKLPLSWEEEGTHIKSLIWDLCLSLLNIFSYINGNS